MAKKLLVTECARCIQKLNTGDEYATEEVSIVNHRFYHWKCIKKDPATTAVVVRASSPYVDYRPTPPNKQSLIEV